MSHRRTLLYDDLILPLLQRMINLEQLFLYLLLVRNNKDYIDGNQLDDDILIYMPRLNKFSFNIDTYIEKNNNQIVFSSNEDIQRSFKRKEYGSVSSLVEYFTNQKERCCHICAMPYQYRSRCHIYSLPYQFEDFAFLTNSFQGGILESVLSLIMTDCCSFEHNFFKLISQSFPLLKQLIIRNNEPQKEKQQSMTLIKFSHLIVLNIASAHTDYAEQFLVDKYCQLPHLLNLSIGYESLARVTNNFTNDATRFTCSQLTSISINESFVLPKNFHQYFPLL